MLTNQKEKSIIESMATGFKINKTEMIEILNKVNKKRYEGDRKTILFIELGNLLDKIQINKGAKFNDLKTASKNLIEFAWEFGLTMKNISYLKLQISIQ